MVSVTSAAVGAVWPELVSRFCRPGLDMFSKKDSAAGVRLLSSYCRSPASETDSEVIV